MAIIYTGPDGKVSQTLTIGKHTKAVKYDNFTLPKEEFDVKSGMPPIEISIPDMIARIVVLDNNSSPVVGADVYVNEMKVGTTVSGGKFDYKASRVLDDQGNLLEYSFYAKANGQTSETVKKSIRCPEGCDVTLRITTSANVDFFAKNSKGEGVPRVAITLDE